MSQNSQNGVKTIILPVEKIIREVPAYQLKIDKVEIRYIQDDPANKRVTAITRGVTGTVVLWEGQAYDVIGQWTDQDVENRIIELFSNN
jgi:hypothetical protein